MSSHHDHGPLGDPVVTEVADRVFAYIQPDGTWWINNTGFLAGDRHTIAVDASSTDRRTTAFIDAIGKHAKAPVTTLVNTHHHGDHTNGNYLFERATIVGHERCREAMLADGVEGVQALRNAGVFMGPDGPPDWGRAVVEPPFLTYTDGVTVHADDIRAEVRYIGTPAHTTNDSIIWLPEQKVLFCGDLLFNGGTPFLLMGSLSGALEAVESLKQLDAQVVVPGHGDVCDLSVADTVLGYLRLVDDLARRAHADGVSPLEAARSTDLGEYAELSDSERIVGNLHRAYAELDGLERGGQIDTLKAIGEMIAYNGGKPLTCYA